MSETPLTNEELVLLEMGHVPFEESEYERLAARAAVELRLLREALETAIADLQREVDAASPDDYYHANCVHLPNIEDVLDNLKKSCAALAPPAAAEGKE